LPLIVPNTVLKNVKIDALFFAVLALLYFCTYLITSALSARPPIFFGVDLLLLLSELRFIAEY
jgi:hypothetical protein